MMELKSYSAFSNQGPYLQLNEDAVEVDLVSKLYLILDGYGGTNIGDRAVANLLENIKKFYTKIGGDPDATMPFTYSHKYLLEGNALINSMHYAHSLLLQENREKEMNERAGASMIAAALSENILTLASTGNCKSYLFRKGRLRPITLPDSMETLAKDNFASYAHTCPKSGFGLFEDLQLKTEEVRLADDDVIVLMTDGSYSRLKDSELRSILQKQEIPYSEKIEKIFQMVNERGNMDNQSLILLQF